MGVFKIKYRDVVVEVSWARISVKYKDLTLETSPLVIAVLAGLMTMDEFFYYIVRS